MNVDPETKEKILIILQSLFPSAKIYLFGSRARGTHTKHSDIDLAIDAGQKLDMVAVGEARNMLNASYIPQKIDVLDLHSVSDEMRKSVLEEGILWKASTKE